MRRVRGFILSFDRKGRCVTISDSSKRACRGGTLLVSVALNAEAKKKHGTFVPCFPIPTAAFAGRQGIVGYSAGSVFAQAVPPPFARITPD